MYKVGAMGDADSVCGFSAVGLNVFPTEDPAEAAKILRNIADEYAVIFITEKLAGEIAGEIDKYRGRTVPAIIPIPGITGNTGIGMRNVSASVEQAVGSDILAD